MVENFIYNKERLYKIILFFFFNLKKILSLAVTYRLEPAVLRMISKLDEDTSLSQDNK